MHNLLLLEDEQNIGATLADLLEDAGYAVIWAQSCAEARDALKLYPFDVALLDVNLPDGTGFDVARLLAATPILFLTAVSDPDARVQGLQLGAEDYIVKPFHFPELLLRIRNALKRQRPMAAKLMLSGAEVDFAAFTFTRDGITEILSAKEVKLLQFLYERRGQVVSRDEILNHVWSSEAFPTPRTVDNFILRLRRLVGESQIRTLRGAGYQWAEDKLR